MLSTIWPTRTRDRRCNLSCLASLNAHSYISRQTPESLRLFRTSECWTPGPPCLLASVALRLLVLASLVFLSGCAIPSRSHQTCLSSCRLVKCMVPLPSPVTSSPWTWRLESFRISALCFIGLLSSRSDFPRSCSALSLSLSLSRIEALPSSLVLSVFCSDVPSSSSWFDCPKLQQCVTVYRSRHVCYLIWPRTPLDD